MSNSCELHAVVEHSRRGPLFSLILLMATVAGLLQFLVLSRMHALQEWSMLPMWVFAGAFLVSEVFFMRLPVRRSALA
ncbi:MAG: hypothetical protein PVI37_11515, partial [Gammaproteobacteria bacterium]